VAPRIDWRRRIAAVKKKQLVKAKRCGVAGAIVLSFNGRFSSFSERTEIPFEYEGALDFCNPFRFRKTRTKTMMEEIEIIRRSPGERLNKSVPIARLN